VAAPLILGGRGEEEIGAGAAEIRRQAEEQAGVGQARRVAFVFSPLRSEYAGMGRDLPSHSAFEAQMQACETALAPLLGWSLRDALEESPAAPPLARLDVSQPLLFAIQVSLARFWSSLGVRPDAVLGHSVGEIAAAACCGALSLGEAARAAATWGRCCRQLEGEGAMASLPLDAEAVAQRISRRRGRLAIAAVNSPSWTAVSGDREAIEELLAELAGEGVHGRSMEVPAPGHSAGMEPVHKTFMHELAALSPAQPSFPFYSSALGRRADPRALDATYWSANLRRPVLFEAALRALRKDGFDAFVEIGPRPVLAAAIEEIAAERSAAVDFSEVPEQETDDVLLDLVLVRATAALGRVAPATADPDATFKDLGFDSAAAVALRDVLNRLTGLRLHATVAFDHPTPRRLAAKLRDDLEAERA